MSTEDPYNDLKIYHKAKLIAPDGSVSPLCAEKPKKLNLKQELWTMDDDAVTCKKCLKKMSVWNGIFESVTYSSGPGDNVYVYG